jgi:hypothetical protein
MVAAIDSERRQGKLSPGRAPPSRVMNSRRLTSSPHSEDHNLPHSEDHNLPHRSRECRVVHYSILAHLTSAMGRVSRGSPVQTAMRNCTRDEGRSFEAGSQVLASNRCKLLSSKAMVVSVAVNVGRICCLRDCSGPPSYGDRCFFPSLAPVFFSYGRISLSSAHCSSAIIVLLGHIRPCVMQESARKVWRSCSMRSCSRSRSRTK